MKDAGTLKGRARWLTWPSTIAVLVGVALGVAYVWAAVEIPPGALVPLLVILAVVVVLFNFLGDAIEQARLAPLTGLGSGRLAVTPDTLSHAARAAAQAPDVTFWTVLLFVAGGSVLSGLTWSVAGHVGIELAARVGVIGLAIAPLAAVTANLSVLPRARVVLRQLLDLGLSEDRLARALPARFETRARVMVYAAVATLTPMFLVLDLVVNRALQAMRHAATTQVAQRLDGHDWLAVGAAGAVVVVMVLACAALGGGALAGPLVELTRRTERVARGDSGHFVVPAEFEIWATSLALGSLEQSLVSASQRLEDASGGISSATGDLRASAQLHQHGIEQQTASLAATTATTEELARSARQIAANAQHVAELAHDTLTAARRGNHSAAAFTRAMQQVREGNQAVADSVVRLNKRVQQVGKIVEFINGIADKSDLLALNAELEGNKAGEVGRGFTLVAAEMRRLAESVMTSTQEISRLIEEIRDATNAAVMATEAGVKATDKGSALAQEVSEGLRSIVDFANLTADAVQSISTSTVQQQAGTDQLVSAMEDILQSTRASAEASGEMKKANDTLATLSTTLAASVQRFRGGA